MLYKRFVVLLAPKGICHEPAAENWETVLLSPAPTRLLLFVCRLHTHVFHHADTCCKVYYTFFRRLEREKTKKGKEDAREARTLFMASQQQKLLRCKFSFI